MAVLVLVGQLALVDVAVLVLVLDVIMVVLGVDVLVHRVVVGVLMGVWLRVRVLLGHDLLLA